MAMTWPPCAFKAIEQFKQLAEDRMVGDLAGDATNGIEVTGDEQTVGSLDQVPDGARPRHVGEKSRLTTTTVTSSD